VAEADPPMLSPTVGRRWLAQEIRRLREAAGFKQSDVAKRLRCNPTKITHIETMRNPINGPDLEVMLPFFGVPADQIDWYLQVCDLSKTKGWWDGDQAIPSWFSLYVGLEWGASEIRWWDMGFVYGMLQTRGYAEAVLQDLNAVDSRLHRQKALYRDTSPLRVHAIFDESVLLRQVGDAETMREQLKHLVALSKLATITIQVMPLSTGAHRSHLGSYHWLGFPQDGDPGAVYVENQLGGQFLEKPEELAVFAADFAELTKLALSAKESVALIAQRAEELQ